MLGNSALRAVKKSCQRYGYLFQKRDGQRRWDSPQGPTLRCKSGETHVEGALLMKSYAMSE